MTAQFVTAEDFDTLPVEMLSARRWLVWKRVPHADPTKKPRKVPYYPDGTTRGDTDTIEDSARLGTFSDALRALATGRYAGLGFSLGPDGTGNYWQGIDLDDFGARLNLCYLAEELPSYTETSPSGNGMHAIGYGRAFASLGSNKSGIEAYAGRRFFTVTADHSVIRPLVCIADFVEQRLAPLHAPAPAPVYACAGLDSDRREIDAATLLRQEELFAANSRVHGAIDTKLPQYARHANIELYRKNTPEEIAEIRARCAETRSAWRGRR